MKTIHVFQNENLNSILKILATIKNIIMIMTKEGFNTLIDGNIVEIKFNISDSNFYVDKKKVFIKI